METRSSPCMQQLRALAADHGLKYYKHLSKPELFALLQREGCAPERLMDDEEEQQQQPEHKSSKTEEARNGSLVPRKRKARASVVDPEFEEEEEASSKHKHRRRASKNARTIVNTLDPIMLTELGPVTVEFVRSNGAVVVYNVDTLVEYMLATGHFAEPETRVPFSDDELERIDREIVRAKLELGSVVQAKRNSSEFDAAKVKRDGLLGMERCAGEYVSKMLEIVESEDTEEGEIELLVNVFPSFSSMFAQLRKSDSEYAKQCMSHFRAFVKGPKNRPSVDHSGLLAVILSFLDDVDTGRQDATCFGF